MNELSPPPARLMRAAASVARGLARLLLVFGVLLALAWAVLQLWIVPRIADFRPRLEALASQAIGQPVRIGDIVGHTGALVPSFDLLDVDVLDAQSRSALRLPRLTVAVSLQSVLRLNVDQIGIERPSLQVRRTADGRVLVAGIDVLGGAGARDTRFADWFFSLPEFVIRRATVEWIDERHSVAPLVLGDLDLVLRNGPRRHALRLDATPPAGWGDRFTVVGLFRRPLLSTHAGDGSQWSGQVYGNFPRLDVGGLGDTGLAELGVKVREGRGAVRAWLDVVDGRLTGAVADLALGAVTVRLAPGLEPLDLQHLNGRVGGKRLAGGFEVFTQGLQFTTREGLQWPGGNVFVSHMEAEGRRPASGEVRVDRLDLQALARIATSLPLGSTTLAALQAQPVAGRVDSLQARWQGPLAAPTTYELRAKATGLDLPALAAEQPASAAVAALQGASAAGMGPGPGAKNAASVSGAAPHPEPGRPGVRGASLEVDMNQAGGRVKLDIANGALEFPGVFEEPVLPLDQLHAQARWTLEGGRIVVNRFDLRLANADVQGDFSGSWQTGEDTRADGKGDRFPGVLDLQGRFSRADGARVWRYLPLVVGAQARHYVREAIVAGELSDVAVRIKGDLNRVPFADPRAGGEFRFAGKVRNATYAFVPPTLATAEDAPWPRLVGLYGNLSFERNGMRLAGASSGAAGWPDLRFSAIEARIADFTHTPTVAVSFDVKGPASDMLGVVNTSPLGRLTHRVLAEAKASGDAAARVRLTIPIDAVDGTRVNGSLSFAGTDLRISPQAPLLSRTRGLLSFTERGFSLNGVQARLYGGDVRIDGGMRAHSPGAKDNPVVLRAQGTATAEGLRQASELGAVAALARQASGAAAYSAQLTVGASGVPELVVTSSLQGLALDLPEPFAKPAESAVPLRIETALETDAPAGAAAAEGAALRERLQLSYGRSAAVTFVRALGGAAPRVLRGSIAVGLGADESAPLPAQGVVANLAFKTLDMDAWERLLPDQPPRAGERTTAGAAPSFTPLQEFLPTSFALRVQQLRTGGRRFDQVVVGGVRDGPNWRANVSASQLDGYVEYRQSGASGGARLHARLARLVVPREAAAQVESLLDEPVATSLPALDIVAEDFELRGKRLGRLEVEAVNRSGSDDDVLREWRLNRLALTTPEALFSASGNWAAVGAQAAGTSRSARTTAAPRRTAMNFRLDIRDAGALLERLGMKGVVRRGEGQLAGTVVWKGSPLSPHYPSMSGQLHIDVERGQFLKADPGLAKLLGVLSLQALPRRLTLDFRDVFSEGFAFDFVRGDATVAEGVARTNNLQMKGVNAAVLIEGEADLVRETQDLRVVVVPEINAGTASLVAAAINPAIGLGTVLAQLFLRQPLIKATTQEFRIDGSWSDPQVRRVETSGPAPARENTP